MVFDRKAKICEYFAAKTKAPNLEGQHEEIKQLI